MEPTNPLTAIFTDALKNQEFRETLKEIFRETLREVNTQVAPNGTKSDYLFLEEFAELLGVTKESARVKKCRGDFPEHLYFKRGKKTIFKRAEVIEWLENGGR